MAKLYDENFSKSLMSFGKSFSRLNGQPLDDSSVYFSYAEAVEYAASASAYVGQPIAVIDKVNNTAKLYLIENEAGGLQEIGANAEFEDTNTTYSLSFIRQEETAEDYAGTIVQFVSSDENEEDIEFFIPDAYDDSELVARIDELEDKVSQKVDRIDVYTTTETDKKIGEAIATADHLKRKIVNLKEDIDVNAADALQYIYMVPIGPTDDDNKYREYIVLENTDGSRYIEQVGNWEVNLSGYLTEADAANTYATAERVNELEEKASAKADRVDVYIISEVDEKFATKNEVTETLKDYATKDEIPVLPNFEDYVTEEEFAERIANYETAETAEGKYVAQEEGKSLISTEEIERLAKVDENAEVNFIKAVNTQALSVNEQSQLDIKQVKQELVSDLVQTTWNIETITDGEGNEINNFVATTKPAKLSEILVPASYDADLKTGVSGLMTAEQVQKLQALVIGDEGIEISGSVNADNVTGLKAWIATNRNDVEGLLSTKVDNLVSELNSIVTNEETGIQAINGKILTIENSVEEYNKRLNAIEYAIAWRSLDEI